MNWYKQASFDDDLTHALVDQMGEEKGKELAFNIHNEIESIGTEYRFENISALGLAKNNVCIISSDIFRYKVPNMIFVLFHELAHYYQYKKYGNEFAMSVYTNPPSEIDEDVDFLREIETTADRFARLKTSHYINKYEMKDSITLPGYSHFSDSFLEYHLLRIKDQIKK